MAPQAQTPARLDAAWLARMPLRLIGPSAPSGRVWSVIGVPSQPKTFYACTAEGGVWRTTNNGTTMTQVFDQENAASCGTVAIAASDPNIVWVGSGEPAARQSVAPGYGVYKTVDGGKSWQHLGLETTQEIAAIVIDPRDPQTTYVGAMGHLWGTNADRGVFKTTDGGRTWRKTLFVDEMTGCIDLAADPHDPNVLYATTWQRLRSGGSLISIRPHETQLPLVSIITPSRRIPVTRLPTPGFDDRQSAADAALERVVAEGRFAITGIGNHRYRSVLDNPAQLRTYLELINPPRPRFPPSRRARLLELWRSRHPASKIEIAEWIVMTALRRL